MLSGCMAYYTYWSPVAQGGRLFYGDNCSTAPSNAVEFTFGGVKISFSGDGTMVGMALNIPEGQSVSFLSDNAVFYLPVPTKMTFDVTDVTYPSTNPKDPEWLQFSPTSTLTRGHYGSRIHFGDKEREQYRIKMPAIKINNQVYEIPEIEFTRKKGFGVFCI